MATTVASNPVEMPVSAASSPAVLDQWGPSGQLLQPVQMGSQYGDEAIGGHGSRPASRVTQSQDAERTVPDGCSNSAGSAPRSGDPRGRNPLIVFDWDDTMLTSSWIQSRELLQAASYEDLPMDAQRDLAHLEQRWAGLDDWSHFCSRSLLVEDVAGGVLKIFLKVDRTLRQAQVLNFLTTPTLSRAICKIGSVGRPVLRIRHELSCT